MPISCVVPGCNNRQYNEKEKNKIKAPRKIRPAFEINQEVLAFHRFPRDEEKRAQWISVVDRDDWKPSKYSYVCSAHFCSTDYRIPPGSPKTLLRRAAIPNQNLPHSLTSEQLNLILASKNASSNIRIEDSASASQLDQLDVDEEKLGFNKDNSINIATTCRSSTRSRLEAKSKISKNALGLTTKSRPTSDLNLNEDSDIRPKSEHNQLFIQDFHNLELDILEKVSKFKTKYIELECNAEGWFAGVPKNVKRSVTKQISNLIDFLTSEISQVLTKRIKEIDNKITDEAVSRRSIKSKDSKGASNKRLEPLTKGNFLSKLFKIC